MSGEHDIARMLAEGGRRTLGRSEEVVRLVRRRPGLLAELFDAVFSDDPGVRMRAADGIEKSTADRPEWLFPYRTLLLEHMTEIEQAEVRWHVAQLLARVRWLPVERQRAVEILHEFRRDRSRIVRTLALQGLF